MPVDWAAVRGEFPALAGWTFLNTASFGQLPRRTVEAVNRHWARRDALACHDFVEWFDDMDDIRELAARLIRCEASDIAFIQNASSALSLLLGGIDWQPGDQIVTLPDEFPNHYYYPAHLHAKGVEFVETPIEQLQSALTDRTRLVLMSTVNYTSGFRPPLIEIASDLRRRGILFYVDGTQSVGALEFDTSAIQPDMLAVHGYKWLLSPNGAGFMYVSPKLRRQLQPAVIGWRSDRNWRSVESLHHGAPSFADKAERYEGGMLPFAMLYAMGESMRMMLEIGAAAIEARVLDLAAKTAVILKRDGAHISHEGSQIVCAQWPDRDASAITREMEGHRVLVAARHGKLRVSPHFYNDESDLARLEAVLGAARL